MTVRDDYSNLSHKLGIFGSLNSSRNTFDSCSPAVSNTVHIRAETMSTGDLFAHNEMHDHRFSHILYGK